MYSPERRTALVLTGTGADGAYHAGVLRALQETGVKIDLVCGRGVGAVAAVLTAIDGGARLWDSDGLWRNVEVARFYRWRWPVRVMLVMFAVVGGLLVSPLIFLALAVLAYFFGLLLGLLGLTLGADLVQRFTNLLAAAFAPDALPTWLPRLMALAVIVALVTLGAIAVVAARALVVKRRSRGARWWAMFGPPLDSGGAARHFITGLWDLLKGGAAVRAPADEDLSRRFTEVLNDNLGQPGFSELLLVVHDMDARRDLVFGLVREPFRRALFPPPGGTGAVARRAEAFDLAGLARDHLIDVLRASLTLPGATAPILVRFPVDTFWRGEAHRLVDRPASLSRLLEEAAAAGAEQVIVVSAAPEPPGPHELARQRIDPLGWLSDHAASSEAAVLRDAVHHVQHRFRALYTIRPPHNPVGAFDLDGAYDEHSDRRHPLAESTQRGYEDAYRAFIEPIVAASGEHLNAIDRPVS